HLNENFISILNSPSTNSLDSIVTPGLTKILKNQGFIQKRTHLRGDLYITFEVTFPDPKSWKPTIDSRDLLLDILCEDHKQPSLAKKSAPPSYLPPLSETPPSTSKNKKKNKKKQATTNETKASTQHNVDSPMQEQPEKPKNTSGAAKRRRKKKATTEASNGNILSDIEMDTKNDDTCQSSESQSFASASIRTWPPPPEHEVVRLEDADLTAFGEDDEGMWEDDEEGDEYYDDDNDDDDLGPPPCHQQ
ncbi:hypothetical protein HK096_010637, partial [Nowakowskiella sp. JEL0078]